MLLPFGSGNPLSPIMVVGEAWGEKEEQAGRPFVGASGQELGRMLHDAGILLSDCYLTNLVNARPPGNNLDAWIPVAKNKLTSDMVKLRGKFVKPIVKAGFASLIKEIELVEPRIIIAMGSSALWALTGKQGIIKWRGSIVEVDTEEMKRCL